MNDVSKDQLPEHYSINAEQIDSAIKEMQEVFCLDALAVAVFQEYSYREGFSHWFFFFFFQCAIQVFMEKWDLCFRCENPNAFTFFKLKEKINKK